MVSGNWNTFLFSRKCCYFVVYLVWRFFSLQSGLVICRQIYYGLVSFGQSQTATNLSSALNIPRAQRVRDATLCLLHHLTYVHVPKHVKFKRQDFVSVVILTRQPGKESKDCGMLPSSFFAVLQIKSLCFFILIYRTWEEIKWIPACQCKWWFEPNASRGEC